MPRERESCCHDFGMVGKKKSHFFRELNLVVQPIICHFTDWAELEIWIVIPMWVLRGLKALRCVDIMDLASLFISVTGWSSSTPLAWHSVWTRTGCWTWIQSTPMNSPSPDSRQGRDFSLCYHWIQIDSGTPPATGLVSTGLSFPGDKPTGVWWPLTVYVGQGFFSSPPPDRLRDPASLLPNGCKRIFSWG